MNKNLKNVILYIGIPAILIISIVAVFLRGERADKSVKYYEIVNKVLTNQISEYQLNLYTGELVYTQRQDGKTYKYTVADPGIFYEDVNNFVLATKSLKISR